MAPKLHKDRGATYAPPPTPAGYPAGVVRGHSEPQAGTVEEVGPEVAQAEAVRAELERPTQKAEKADWVTYAEAQGIDVTDLTKDQIIKKVS